MHIQTDRALRATSWQKRALEPDDPVVRHLAEALRADQREMAMPLDPRRRKARFMASYCLSESRDVAGKARRKVS